MNTASLLVGFWPLWFAADNVFLSGDHLAYLSRRFEPVQRVETAATLPYLPLLCAPYYRFLGRKGGNRREAGLV